LVLSGRVIELILPATAAEISAHLHIHPQTLKRHAREGILNAQRVNDKGQILFAPFDGQPPEPQEGKTIT
jgi:hypothetical protein